MTSVQELLEEMKRVQSSLLAFLEDNSNVENNFQDLKSEFEEIKIHSNMHKVKSFLRLLTRIANEHHRGPDFNRKVEQILQFFQEDIKTIANSEQFNIFKNNRLILLYLIEQKIMIFDDYIAQKIYHYYDIYESKKYDYINYFLPEIKPFLPKLEKIFDQESLSNLCEKEIPPDFYEKRKLGENDSYICSLIRADSIEDFITHVNKINCSVNSKIEPSIYETNPFLIKNKPSLIEYAAFYGSIQIFQYLKMNGADITQSLWNYVIHSQNAELIHRLEEYLVKPENDNDCFNESLKCHHNDFANYIKDNLLTKENENDTFIKSIKYFNFAFIQSQNIKVSSFFDICHYGNSLFASVLMNYKDIDINHIYKKKSHDKTGKSI